MSITFFAPEAPDTFESYPCGCEPAEECPDCDGSGEIRFPCKEGEFNVSNSNGMALQRFLCLDPEAYGDWTVEKLSTLQARVDGFLSSPLQTNARARDIWGIGFPQGRIQGYLMSLATLTKVALKHNSPICWG